MLNRESAVRMEKVYSPMGTDLICFNCNSLFAISKFNYPTGLEENRKKYHDPVDDKLND